ncbi:hypothetical protein TNCV_1335211 [Trichonephila clavipes]|nr:hypothetical protein TNCV_1335211 [Trichonephila clavipes]
MVDFRLWTPWKTVCTTACHGSNLNMQDYLQMHSHRIGVKDSACCPLCHQVEMDGDHLRHCPIVLKFFADNSMEANFDFFTSSSFYWAASRLMAEMPNMGVG